MKRLAKNLGLYLVLIVLVVSLVNVFLSPVRGPEELKTLTYSEFMKSAEGGQVRHVALEDGSLKGEMREGSGF